MERYDVAAALMDGTGFAASRPTEREPALVALVQTATFLPVLLVGVPAGALADIMDRRRLLLVTQTWMMLTAALLAGLSFAGLVTSTSLLALTFARSA